MKYLVTVYNESDAPLAIIEVKGGAFTRQLDATLSNYLKDYEISPVYEIDDMGRIAASVVYHLTQNFKTRLLNSKANLKATDYAQIFEIRFVRRPYGSVGPHRISLSVADSYGRGRNISLYSDDFAAPKILRRVMFVYDKQKPGEPVKWRTLDVTEEDSQSISGFEDGQFKRFLKSKVVGGKILPA